MAIQVEGLTKVYGDFPAVSEASFEVADGSLVALLGPSGSGKSTVLRMIAGLIPPDAGRVLFDGRDVTRVPVQHRNVGFVFQQYALFKHMTVFDNIAFGLVTRKHPKAEIAERVREMLAIVQLDDKEHRYPSQLSGGERQRVALARALASKPTVLLLDEPFGAIDTLVRQELREWLRRLHDDLHVTSIFVTHDQEEALEISDRVVVMSKGRVEQVGTPVEIYEHPATPFVSSFVGPVNVIPAQLQGDVALAGPFAVDAEHLPEQSGRAAAMVRPADIQIEPAANGQANATVQRVAYLGWGVKVRLVADGGTELVATLPAEQARAAGYGPGDRVIVSLGRARLFPESGPDWEI